jgi:hypothetical protein
MAPKTPMVVVLNDGEGSAAGSSDDQNCLKVNRAGPNLLIPKTSIKYLFKQGEEEAFRGGNR